MRNRNALLDFRNLLIPMYIAIIKFYFNYQLLRMLDFYQDNIANTFL